MDKIIISGKQYAGMLHAIGGAIKRKPYRNYYNTGRVPCAMWDDLVSKKLTVRGYRGQLGGYFYFLTKKGLDYLIAEKRGMKGNVSGKRND